MKFTIDRDTIKAALDCAIKSMDMNSTLPILSGVLITASEAHLTLENTNMEASIRQKVIANIEDPGRVVVPCKLLADIVGHLPDMAITFALEGSLLSIKCGRSSYNLNTMPAADFPQFPKYKLDSRVDIATESLNSMVSRVAVAASTDKNRTLLNGILVCITPDMVRFVATDSMRMAVAESKIASNTQDFEVIAPAKTLKSVLSLASGCPTIAIGTNATQLVFLFDEVEYVARRIEGTYPNYRKLIPTSHNTGVRVKTNDLYQAMQRVKAMTSANSEVYFETIVEQGTLTISSNLPDQGNAREEIAVEAEGTDIRIAFNSRFIYDWIQKADEDEEMLFEMDNPDKPGIFRTFADEKENSARKVDLLYLVMPVRLNR